MIDVKLDLNLRDATRRRGNALQIELAKHSVMRGHPTLPLVHFDRDSRLRIGGGAEDVLFLDRNGRVALDQRGQNAPLGLDSQRQRRDIQQQDILPSPAKTLP